MKQKINLRLTLIALLAVICTTIAITIVSYRQLQIQVKEDLMASVRLLNETDLFQSLYKDYNGEPASLDQEALEKLRMDSLRITWIDADGTVLYDNDTDIAGLSNHLDRPEIQAALENGVGVSVRRSDTLNLNTYYSAMKLDNGTILRVSTNAQSFTSIALSIAPVILVISLCILVMCIVLGHLLTLQLLKPINQMAEQLDDQMAVPVYKELEPFANKIRSQHENILDAASIRQDFTASISHELKTPLTAIAGYAELIENHMVEGDQAVHIAGQIRQNSDRLLSLINDIIKLSELDHTELPRTFVNVDLYELASECCRNLQVNAWQNELKLTCEGTPVYLNGDRDLLKEMIENLVQNAIRYNVENGRIHVTVTNEHAHAVLTVEDTGIGIPKHHQAHIFERFYRVDKSRSRATGGTGLGLAIVKHIAEIHHAKIELESEEGKGTRIRVLF